MEAVPASSDHRAQPGTDTTGPAVVDTNARPATRRASSDPGVSFTS